MPRKKEPQGDNLTPEEIRQAAGQEFLDFLGSLPADVQVGVTLLRLPNKHTPEVLEQERLPPPDFRPELEDMIEEVRQRYGAGSYKLYIRYTDPISRRRKMVSPRFILGPDPSAPPPPPVEIGDPGAEHMQEVFGRLHRAVNMRAQAAEINALQDVVSGTGKPERPPRDPLDQVAKTVELVRGMTPNLDPLALVKFALEHRGGQDRPMVAELAAAMREMITLARELGGGETRSSLIVDLVLGLAKEFGPYLPAVVAGVRQAVQTTPPAAVEIPPAIPPPGAPPPAQVGAAAAGTSAAPGGVQWAEVLRAVGGDPTRADRLRSVLLAAWIELEAPEEAWPDGFDRTIDFCEAHLPGFLGSLLTLDPSRVTEMWRSWHPATQDTPRAPRWIAGLLERARSPIPGEER